MKKNSKNKLVLNKEFVAKLSELDLSSIKGGVEQDSAVGMSYIGGCTSGCPPFTSGDCDIPTIGWDDGPFCISKTKGSWCYGQA